jgi:hypothetical protein
VTFAATLAGSRLSVTGSMSASTGRAPRCSITAAVAVNVIGEVITSSPRPTARRLEGEVERRRARVDGERMTRAHGGGKRLLELEGARPGRQPARLEATHDARDLLLADVGNGERQPGRGRNGNRAGGARFRPGWRGHGSGPPREFRLGFVAARFVEDEADDVGILAAQLVRRLAHGGRLGRVRARDQRTPSERWRERVGGAAARDGRRGDQDQVEDAAQVFEQVAERLALARRLEIDVAPARR